MGPGAFVLMAAYSYILILVLRVNDAASLYGLIGAWFSIEAVFMVNVFCAGLRLGTLAVVIATGWSEGLWVLVLGTRPSRSFVCFVLFVYVGCIV